jgi:hypothetical protein
MPRRKKRMPIPEGGGRVFVTLMRDMWEGLNDVRDQLSQLRGDIVPLSTVVRMYLEKGLIADKALPRPHCSEKVEGS